MNIKGLVRNLIPLPTADKTAEAVAVSKRTETGSASDRDANGKQEQAEQETLNRHLTTEELNEAVKHLESLQGVKENNLRVLLTQDNGINVIHVKDSTGKVVRRMTEQDIWWMLKTRKNADPKKGGQLLNKSA